MKQLIFLWLTIGWLTVANSQKSADPTMDRFINDLMKKMTLEEKLGQLNLPSSGDIVTGQAKSSDISQKIREGKVGGLFNIKSAQKILEVQRIAVEESRLKIPLLFGMDVIHGYETVFPIPLGLSATWNMDLIERSARIAAIEASTDGIGWTFSPMVDISRDARWGRFSEGSGEDPYLGSQIAKAMVKGYQQNNLRDNTSILSCVKHFALYGAAEAGRDYNTVDMSPQRMYNDYLPPYKAAVEAGVGSVMASFNEINGIPAHANKWLLTDVLRKQWGFKGFVVSDYTGINEMIAHGIGDLQEVSAKSLAAGNDMDMVGEGFLTTLKQSLQEKKITQALIDNACRKILEAKYKLGLFDNPYKYGDVEKAKSVVFSAAHRKEARAIAAESFVLLKNKNNVLPLKKAGTIGLIGPLVDNTANMFGTWSVAAQFDKSVTIVQGIKNAVGEKATILTARGSNFIKDKVLEDRYVNIHNKQSYLRDGRSDEEMLIEALEIARKSDVVVAVLGEASEFSGESSSVTDLELPDVQKHLLKALQQMGKPIVLVLFTGRPLALKWEAENIPALLNVWFPGSEAGDAVADVLFGDVNPSGKLTASFPQVTGQVPLYYAQKNTGRPVGTWFEKFRSNYLDVSNDALFPFGYGLSYSSFTYGEIKANKTHLKANEILQVTIPVTNTSSIAGKETVQLYIRDLVGSVTRPVKELKGFQKLLFQPGETKQVSFTITSEDLKFYNYDLQQVWEPGEFEIMIGPNARDLRNIKVNWIK